MGWAWIFVGVLICAWCPAARADESYVLQYKAPRGCPTERTFRADVAAHVHKGRDAAGMLVEARVDARVNGFQGVLVTTDRNGNRGQRSVEGRHCAEVTHALAFLAGLAVDLGGVESDAEPAPAAQGPAAEVHPPVPTPPAAPARPPPPASAPAGEPTAPPWAWRIGASEEARFGLGQVPRFGAAGGIEVDRLAIGVFAPELRLELTWADGLVESPLGSAFLVLLAARATGCPFRWGVLGIVSFRACGEGEVGRLWAVGSTVAVPQSPALPWLSVGASVYVRWPEGERVFVEVAGGVTVPVIQARFFFEPDATVYTVQAVIPRFAVGSGLRF